MKDGDGSSQQFEALRRVSKDLKRCPLCGAINAVVNDDCFVCSWHGIFATDEVSVEEGLSELFIRCPELFDAMFDVRNEPLGIRDRISAFVVRIRKWFRPNPMPKLDWG